MQHPPIMIAGGGEQLTLRAVARLAQPCNVGGEPDTARNKSDVLRRHCEAGGRDYDTIERTHNNSLAASSAMWPGSQRSSAPVGARAVARVCRHRLRRPSTWSAGIRDAGVQLLINYRNDIKIHEPPALDVMPHFSDLLNVGTP